VPDHTVGRWKNCYCSGRCMHLRAWLDLSWGACEFAQQSNASAAKSACGSVKTLLVQRQQSLQSAMPQVLRSHCGITTLLPSSSTCTLSAPVGLLRHLRLCSYSSEERALVHKWGMIHVESVCSVGPGISCTDCHARRPVPAPLGMQGEPARPQAVCAVAPSFKCILV
jgi:hypothetical protein